MASEIKELFGASTALTITLASLASSTSGVGRQSTMVSNSSSSRGVGKVRVFAKVTTGTSPTVNKTIRMYLLRGDDPASSNYRTDGAGASDAGFTQVRAELIAAVLVTATSNVAYYLEAVVDPGPEFGIAIVHDTVAALNATGGNHFVRYVTDDPENQ